MNRTCPNCSKPAVATKDLLFGAGRCSSCDKDIQVRPTVATLFSIATFIIATVTTLLVYNQFGYFTAAVWFSAPVGAISYLKAKFGSLSLLPDPP